eukprot:scaffold28784_cov57-Phaeocystis_antarctica.AAC.2
MHGTPNTSTFQLSSFLLIECALPVHLFDGPAVSLIAQGQGAARAHRVDHVSAPKLEEVAREERTLADDRPRGQPGKQQEHARPAVAQPQPVVDSEEADGGEGASGVEQR